MRPKLPAMGLLMVLILIAVAACGGTSTPAPDPSPEPMPTDTKAAATPEPTEAELELVPFEDEAGVFSIDYPSDFSQVEESRLVGNYGYNFVSPEKLGSLIVAFNIASDQAISDEEWQAVVPEYGTAMLQTLSQGFAFEFEELKRETGEGEDHSLYLEAKTTDGQLHLVFETQESKGVLGVTIYILPNDQWQARQASIADSLASFKWSPEAAREKIGQVTGQQSSQMVAFIDPDNIFAIEYPIELEETQGPEITGSSYSFSAKSPDGPHYISIFFNLVGDDNLPDEEWQPKTEAVVSGIISSLGDDAVEVNRIEGSPGTHWLYAEAESESKGMHVAILLEEIDGVLAMAISEIPSSDWPNWQQPITAAMENLRWAPGPAREILEQATNQ